MSMTPERIEQIKPYFTNEQLDELSREYRTMPTDGEGYAIEPEYEGMAARGNIVKLVSDLKASRAALEESQQQVEEQRDINEGVRVMARDWHAEAKHWKAEHERSRGELAEVQQTIALKDEALRDYEHNRKIYQQELRAAYDTTGIPSR